MPIKLYNNLPTLPTLFVRKKSEWSRANANQLREKKLVKSTNFQPRRLYLVTKSL